MRLGGGRFMAEKGIRMEISLESLTVTKTH